MITPKGVKIDKRKSYYLMIDTETCNSLVDYDTNKLDLSQSIVYDIGMAIIDKKGNIYDSYSFMLRDIVKKYNDLLNTAYYRDKLPQYYVDIKCSKRQLVNLSEVRFLVKELCEKYGIKAIIAHNAYFDIRSLNNTVRYVTKSKFRYFFPYGIEVWDTLKMCKVITKRKSYREFCVKNGYMTNHKTPRPQEKAETLYRYITKDTQFVESHTGLEDVKIEAEIFAYCIKQHKKMNKVLYSGNDSPV